MGRRSAVGVNNGNFRAGDYYRYWLEVEAGKRGIPSAAEIERMTTKKKMRAMYWMQRLSNAVSALQQADPIGWEAWYDDDQNVPAEANDKDYALLVEARVRYLTGRYDQPKACVRRDIFIWTDQIGPYVYSKEVGKRTLYAMPFDTFEEAESFVQALPFANRGYGVVLDILPASALTPLSAITPTSPQIENHDLEGEGMRG